MPSKDCLDAVTTQDHTATHRVHLSYDRKDRAERDIPIVIVWNGRDQFAPTKPLVTPEKTAQTNRLIMQQGIFMQYMLKRAVGSQMTKAQIVAWSNMYKCLRENIGAFANNEREAEDMFSSIGKEKFYVSDGMYNVIVPKMNV